MKIRIKQGFIWGIPMAFILLIGIFRWIPQWAEIGYARCAYPAISSVLSSFSSLFSFSVGDCFIAAACLFLLIFPFYAWRRRKGGWYTIRFLAVYLMWVYIWFYGAWGINYFRQSFYERAGIPEVSYSAENFQDFLQEYVDSLNQSYKIVQEKVDSNWLIEPHLQTGFTMDAVIHGDIIKEYRKIAGYFGLVKPDESIRPKWMLWSGGMSKVGISGYMGPFFSEFNLNRDLLNVEYPFTYAHELAHRLGIAGEAEANLYAALVTVRSSVPEIRFSGYFSLLGYTMNNARRLLTEEEYKQVLKQISPEIIGAYRKHLIYWQEKYNSSAGKMQNKMYNAYLKGNKIENGTKNYSEVVGMLISLRETGYFK